MSPEFLPNYALGRIYVKYTKHALERSLERGVPTPDVLISRRGSLLSVRQTSAGEYEWRVRINNRVYVLVAATPDAFRCVTVYNKH